MLIVHEIIRWVGIVGCVAIPVFATKKVVELYLTEKHKNDIARKDNEMLWAHWEQEKNLERKLKWEEQLKALLPQKAITEETTELEEIKKKNGELQEKNNQLEKQLEDEIKKAKAIMLFHKLAAEKEVITSLKVDEAWQNIDRAYDQIKKIIG